MAVYREDSAGLARLQRETRNAMEDIADRVALDARRTVPVDTGLLKSRIHAMDVIPGAGFASTVRVVARTHYAHYVDLGTRFMRSRPYLRNALYRKRSR